MTQRNASAAVSEKSAPTVKGQSAKSAGAKWKKRTKKSGPEAELSRLRQYVADLESDAHFMCQEYTRLRDKLLAAGIPVVEDENGN